MVDLYEKDSAHPVSLENLSEKTMRQVRGIVGFRIVVASLEGAYKLSQGREADHPRIIEELERRGSAASAVARAMNDAGNKES
jgi:transcriptional regulator